MAKRARDVIMVGDLETPTKFQRIGDTLTEVAEPTPPREVTSAVAFIERVRQRYSSAPHIYKDFLRIMQQFKSKELGIPEVAAQIQRIFSDSPDLVNGFSHFLPQGQPIQPVQKVIAKPPAQKQRTIHPQLQKKESNLSKAQNFILKAKYGLRGQPHLYKNFIRSMKQYHAKKLSLRDIFIKFTEIFQDHSDLLLEFPTFLPTPLRQEEMDPFFANVTDFTFFERVKSQLKNEPEMYKEFLKCLHLTNKEILTPQDLLVLVEDLFLDFPLLFDEFREFCKFDERIEPNAMFYPLQGVAPLEGIVSKFDVDYAACRRFGPSYRALPKDYLRPPSSGRTPLCNEVINDEWVSIGPDEGVEFKSSEKNVHEEHLFRCEDDRYEMDMRIEQNRSTICALQVITTEMMNVLPEELTDYQLNPDCLDVIHVRCIKRVFGERFREILSNLFDNPVISVPRVLKRLQQKDSEWTIARVDCNKGWQVIHEKNYFRSLDHRSTSFKATDKENLTLREFLYEINKQKFNAKMAGETRPHLFFPITQKDVLKDLIALLNDKLLKGVSTGKKKSCAPEVEFFETFVKIFFLQSSDLPPVTQRVLYGSDEFYVFLRLFETAYSRLATIFQLSIDSFKRRVPTPVRAAQSFVKNPKISKFDSVDEVYRYFMAEMLDPLLKSELEQTKYEEECKRLFGRDAYLLSTFDSIVKLLREQMNLIVGDSDTMRLLALFSWESTRMYEDGYNYVYCTNALELLGQDRCYRCMFDLNDGLSISLLDDIKEKSTLLLATARDNLKQYLADFARPAPSTTVKVARLPFLARNKKKTTKVSGWNENLEVNQRLTCKICLVTFKMFFVSNTEDYFYRKGTLQKGRKIRTKKKTW